MQTARSGLRSFFITAIIVSKFLEYLRSFKVLNALPSRKSLKSLKLALIPINTYYLYLGAVFGFAYHMYGSSALSGALTTASVPNFKTAYIKKVEALNWYHRNAITDPPITGTCNVRVDVYYNEMTKVRG